VSAYATAEELVSYVQDNPDVQVPGEPTAVERLLQRAERRVDGVLGPYAPDSTTGLKLNPSSLTTVQKAALSRATCAAAEHELAMGPGFYVGEEDFIPAGLAVLRRAAATAPKVLAELAGHGLLIRSGCAEADPDEDAAS
jgi:hypothetical protein